MARKTKTRRRRQSSFKILNALEALAYGQIISVGLTGGGLYEFVTGKQDLGYSSRPGGLPSVTCWVHRGIPQHESWAPESGLVVLDCRSAIGVTL